MLSTTRIFKFGGASVNSADAVRNVAEIVSSHANGPLVVVVSAMDKMTNALESVVEAYIQNEPSARDLLEQVKAYHWQVMQELFEEGHAVYGIVNDFFVEIDWVIEEPVQDTREYIYDQVVSIGELVSTAIVSAYLNQEGITAIWCDARNFIITDDAHGEARVQWDMTRNAVESHVTAKLGDGAVVVTQGFIGCTTDNNTTTLGREGSDYTAAILANCTDAREVVIWKDVSGIMSADPARFENVERLDRLTYREAIEMTYYGAKVLHPKTIKPLQNKQIPLYVRSFVDPGNGGTQVGTEIDTHLPPVVIVEEGQALIHIATRDFSFVAEHHLGQIFPLLAELRIKVHMMRNSAISFILCCNDHPGKIGALTERIEGDFSVVVDHGLKLITVRHANNETVDALLEGHTIVLEESFQETKQYVVRAQSSIRPKH